MSRSGVIRKAIGPAKARLVAHMKTVTSNIIPKAVPEDVKSCIKQLDDVQEIEGKIRNSIATLKEKDEQWRTIICNLGDDDLADEEQLYSNTALDDTEGFLNVVELGKEMLCSLERRRTELNRIINDVAPKPKSSSSASHKVSVKLPKLTLPSFGGCQLEWPKFWAIFKINVHDQELAPTEKFAYLCGQLSGPALSCIDGLSLTDQNYQAAVTILKERFERSPTQLVGVLYSQLKRLPKSSGRVSELLSTYDNCEKIFRQLSDAGEAVDANRSLVLDVLSKYPSEVIKELMERKNIGSESTLAELRKALHKYIKQCEDLAGVMDDLDPFDTKSTVVRPKALDKSPGEAEYRPSKQTSAFTAPSNRTSNSNPGTPQKPPNPCYFCSEPHFNSQCPKYTTSEQRTSRLRSLDRCVRCMSSAHKETACPMVGNRIRCFFCKTTGQHMSPLCPQQFGPTATSTPKNASSQSPCDQGNTSSVMLNINEQALLLTASTTAINQATDSARKIRILFDSGSHRSYMTEKCADALGLQAICDESLQVAVFGTSRTLSVSSRQVAFGIRQRDGTSKIIHAHTTPMITNCPLMPAVLPSKDTEMLKKLSHSLADNFDSSDGSIDVLIGSDYFWEFLSGARTTTPSGLYFIPSTLGGLIGGRFQEPGSHTTSTHSTLLCITETFSRIANESGLVATPCHLPTKYPDIDEFWELEKIGITDDPEVKDDDEALRQFNESVYLAEGRYHVTWPWKRNGLSLPTNYELAVGRFKSLAKRLRSTDNGTREAYQTVIDDQLRKNVIERVTDDIIKESDALKNQVHYLPHHPVIKPSSSTTKVRIVYDASARTRKDIPSLNECLYRGPVLLPDLCAMLLRFRSHPIAIVSDIEKAFLQLCLQPTERDVTRFLWFDDPANPNVENNVATYRFRRVPFGIISSPFLLSASILFHLKTIDDWVARRIMQNIYVDNVITGVNETEEASQFYSSAKEAFSSASMNLQEWCSNSEEVMHIIPQHDQVKDRDLKILGMQWDSKEDTLRLRYDTVLPGMTKRHVLQSVASIYDPLGLFQPVVLQAKLFLQDLWTDNLGWDDEISEEHNRRWVEIRANILPVKAVRIPRCPQAFSASTKITIVTFCDASITSYATAVYLRSPMDEGQFVSNLVYSKSRLAPKQKSNVPVSLPRLELLGVTIGARASKFVRDALQAQSVVPVYLFTDSSCVLHWLNSPKPLSVFVENRVKEVNALGHAEFLYVNTNDNPADMSTRGKSAHELRDSALWWKGPGWLSTPRVDWPVKLNDLPPPSDECTRELRKSPPVFHTLLVGEDVPRLMGIDPVRYSSFRKLLRVTIWCLKFIKIRVCNKAAVALETKSEAVRQMFNDVTCEGHVSLAEINRARTMWVTFVQNSDYSEVKKAIFDGGRHTLVKQLGLNCDDRGVMRCYGRLQNADLSLETINPILLPRNSHVTNLIIRETHERLFHAGIGHTLSQIRREFWIPQGRAVVRKILYKCVLCRKYKGAPFALPKMPPWPKERLARSSPFQFTGLDYLGPINVRIGSETQKMWICLFTCLAVRAIHLEWVSDCSAKEFLRCLIRFISRRGTPSEIISDHAPQFRVTKTVFDRLWQNILSDDSVRSYAAESGIVWKFTTELAPWKGGFYERLVGIVKMSLRSAVGRRLLEWEELVTVSTEVEAIVNSRPITYVYSELQSATTLRPVDFLTDLPVGMPVTDSSLTPRGLGDAGKNLIRMWKHKEKRLDSIWEVWYNEYLLSLRERYQTKHKAVRGEINAPPSVDQLVLVKESDNPRGVWKTGVVTKIIPSRDNLIRSAEVKLPNGNTLRRAINHLFPLEIDTPGTGNDNDPNNNDANDNDPNNNEDTGNGPNNNAVRNDNDDQGDFDGFTQEEIDGTVDRMRTARVNIINGLTAVAMKLEF